MKKIVLEISLDAIDPFSDSFYKVKSDAFIDLKKENKEYSKLLKDQERILYKYPHLRSVIEDGTVMELTEKETQGLVDIYNLCLRKRQLEDYALYLKSIKMGYLIFKKIELIKD